MLAYTGDHIRPDVIEEVKGICDSLKGKIIAKAKHWKAKQFVLTI